MDAYADLGLGGVDASIVAMAERLGVTEVATLEPMDEYLSKPFSPDKLA